MTAVAGIDMGAKTIKVVVLRDGEPAGRAMANAGMEAASAAEGVVAAALAEAGLTREELVHVVASGAGRELAPGADSAITEVSAAARGALSLFATARTVVDVGAEEARAICVDARGRVLDFAVNDKCAAGAGAFTEAMARALEVSLEELGPLSLESTESISINAQCVVFAESEVVSMIHSNVPKADMARAVHEGIANRVGAMVRKVGLVEPLVLVGGLARNVGFIDALTRGLELDGVAIPEQPEYCVALGAALLASERAG